MYVLQNLSIYENKNNNFKVNLSKSNISASMNNTNLVQLMAQTKKFQTHRQKIAEIMNKNVGKGSAGSFDNKRIKVINTFYTNHDRASRYSIKSKQQAVEKQNDLILRKIIEVNNRRSGSLANKYQTISHNSMANMKKTMQNINLENQKIAQKLVGTNSDLRQQKLYSSFKKHLELKERIKKYEYDEEVGSVIPKKMKSLQKIKTIETSRNPQLSRYASRIQQQDDEV